MKSGVDFDIEKHHGNWATDLRNALKKFDNLSVLPRIEAAEWQQSNRMQKYLKKKKILVPEYDYENRLCFSFNVFPWLRRLDL